MSFPLARSAAGVALLAALTAGCGTAVTAHPAAQKPPAAAQSPHHAAPMHTAAATSPAPAHRHHHSAAVRTPVTTPPAPQATAPPATANPIPQGNGGDQDGDNNGGPSDGDGNI